MLPLFSSNAALIGLLCCPDQPCATLYYSYWPHATLCTLQSSMQSHAIWPTGLPTGPEVHQRSSNQLPPVPSPQIIRPVGSPAGWMTTTGWIWPTGQMSTPAQGDQMVQTALCNDPVLIIIYNYTALTSLSGRRQGRADFALDIHKQGKNPFRISHCYCIIFTLAL